MEGIPHEEKQVARDDIRTLDVFGANGTATQAVHGPMFVRAVGGFGYVVRGCVICRGMISSFSGRAAFHVILMCFYTTESARPLTLPTMEERAGYRLRQHQESYEYADSHKTPHIRHNRPGRTRAKNHVASHYRYKLNGYLNKKGGIEGVYADCRDRIRHGFRSHSIFTWPRLPL